MKIGDKEAVEVKDGEVEVEDKVAIELETKETIKQQRMMCGCGNLNLTIQLGPLYQDLWVIYLVQKVTFWS